MNNLLSKSVCIKQLFTNLIEQLKALLPQSEEMLDKWCAQNLAEDDISDTTQNYLQDFISENNLSHHQQTILAAVVVAYAYPTFYYTLHTETAGDNRLGIYNDQNTGLSYPTVQTLCFFLFGYNYNSAFYNRSILLSDALFKGGVLETSPLPSAMVKNNPLNHIVSINDDYLAYFTMGEFGSPKFSASFPATKVSTLLNWNDLVLEENTLDQVKEITSWYKHRHTLMRDWGLNKILKPGYRALFYGPSGTGKTLTASIMGKELGLDVYRVDLSMVVSKYIGETEKNLSTLFDKAASKNWILFFDEADALFGTRTNVKDAHDKYANQEVSYLLQRVEDFDGIIILATNLKGNIDKAFSRRFQSMVRFKLPDYEQRLKLWQNSFSKHTHPEKESDITEVAKNFELSGGSIVNVVQYASLKAAERDSNIILLKDVKTGISRELQKDGKTG